MSTRAGYAGLPTPPGAARERSAGPPRLGPRPRAAAAGVPGSAAPRRNVPARSRSSTVPTNKQRREAAQRHLQRQLERRTELAKKRRRNLAVVATVVAVVVVVGAALLIPGVFRGDDTEAAADPSATSAPTAAATTNADGTITCTYTADDSGNPSLKDVG